ncbi:carbohydrate kinase family protein [Emcibacter sp.]|uniref:carbohydrate kinase family protein n=1 Tax=Emcibacter sp. TaxID=1979954 RepID=UPI002AA6AE5B|nr:carbohydrate kinase family protein [Emcibacter sp.]
MTLDRNGKILVCGSIAFDTIMVFNGQFKGHILPDKVHMLNVAFRVPEMRQEFGGCAGNICYNLSLLGLKGLPVATVGEDFWSYKNWLGRNNISDENILEIKEKYTAQAHIITDMDDNQITGFHPGAMDQSHEVIIRADHNVALGVISPDGHEGMKRHTKQLAELGIPIMFDPGQEVSSLKGDELMWLMEHSRWMVVNDYEWQLFSEKTHMSIEVATEMLDVLIVTKGSEGSVIHTRDNSFNIPKVPTEDPVDATGCGDAYRAGIIYGLMHGHDWPTTGRIASLLATYKISHRGAQNHHFTMDQFRDHFARQFMVTLG